MMERGRDKRLAKRYGRVEGIEERGARDEGKELFVKRIKRERAQRMERSGVRDERAREK